MSRLFYTTLLCSLLLRPAQALCQSTVSADSSAVGSYLSLAWDNDAFQLRAKNTSDRYYTNGVHIRLLSNYWRKWPTHYALLKLGAKADRRYTYQYDFGVGQEIYTPRNITVRDRPLYPNDHPYAGYLYLSWGLVTSDAVAGRRLTSKLTAGVIGPLSGAAEVQQWFHLAENFKEPKGWGTQMPNDPAISYYVGYDTRIVPQFTPVVDIIGHVDGNIGMLSNYVTMGTLLRIGLFNDYFQNATGLYDPSSGQSRRRIQFYATLGTSFRAVLDNSLLQGGWFKGVDNYYALPAVELEHFLGLIDVGGVVAYKNVQLSFTQSLQTSEFKRGLDHQWGRFGLLFRCGHK
ncbi:lipid A deacylase LpxR family protein [Spirosoma oryzicola]|uniref:lipid A deacylase LpxR family protein n=1 Tax=Spirosoma oryzicola TaxID=2898794 RepID=UPI001E3E8BC0|nr:lipid A deacylase LpxR family protein [Spirosoma oryzicola]UHG92002.1 lipid A deacylase LpxR family protein [Spirosoma oryzicola]